MLQPWKNRLKVRNPKRASENLKTILMMMRTAQMIFQGQLWKKIKITRGQEISSKKKSTWITLNWHLRSKWDRICCKVGRTLKSCHPSRTAWLRGPRTQGLLKVTQTAYCSWLSLLKFMMKMMRCLTMDKINRKRPGILGVIKKKKSSKRLA